MILTRIAPRAPLAQAELDEPTYLRLHSPIDDILAAPPPRGLRRLHLTVLLMLSSLALAASLVRVDIIVTASGRLAADAPTLVIQPLSLSILRELLVKPGDVVRRGQVVARLDPTGTDADRHALRAQQAAEQAEITRLNAELRGIPPDLDPATPDAALQRDLYDQRQSQYRVKLRGFDDDIARDARAIAALDANRQSLARQLAITHEVEAIRGHLYQMAAGSKLNFLGSQATSLQLERDYQDAGVRQDALIHDFTTSRDGRKIFVEDWRRQLLEALAHARAAAAATEGALAHAEQASTLVELRAPADGVVTEIATRSAGSVLHEAEPLVTLVPANAPLIAEVMIASSDVGEAAPGDEVALKIDAFAYQRHGVLGGRLRAIGEESVQSNGGVFHRSEVTLKGAKLHALRAGIKLIPGMTLTAEIKTGTRSVMSYFLYPITRSFTESLREP